MRMQRRRTKKGFCHFIRENTKKKKEKEKKLRIMKRFEMKRGREEEKGKIYEKKKANVINKIK